MEGTILGAHTFNLCAFQLKQASRFPIYLILGAFKPNQKVVSQYILSRCILAQSNTLLPNTLNS